MADLRSVHVLISGRVQGVAFRFATERRASSLGLSGWVRNLAGGGVEAVFRGPAAHVEEMIAWCRRGPPAAQVTGVQVGDAEPDDGRGGFAIRPDADPPGASAEAKPGGRD